LEIGNTIQRLHNLAEIMYSTALTLIKPSSSEAEVHGIITKKVFADSGKKDKHNL